MDALLKMTAINKSFASVHVCKTSISTWRRARCTRCWGKRRGQVHAHQNSRGVYTKDSGEIVIDGKEARISDVASAQRHGISIIHQS
jgi:ABC-type sugar transport system ATPase subunit